MIRFCFTIQGHYIYIYTDCALMFHVNMIFNALSQHDN